MNHGVFFALALALLAGLAGFIIGFWIYCCKQIENLPREEEEWEE
jgi:hypothetical protein